MITGFWKVRIAVAPLQSPKQEVISTTKVLIGWKTALDTILDLDFSIWLSVSYPPSSSLSPRLYESEGK